MKIPMGPLLHIVRFVIWGVLCLVLVAACSFLLQQQSIPNFSDSTLGLEQDAEGRIVGIFANEYQPSVEDLRKLKDQTSIRRIDLTGARVNDAIMSALPNLSGLKTLSLHSTNVTDEQLLGLGDLTSLVELRLNRTPNLIEGLLCFGPLPNLEQIDLVQCSWLTDEHLPVLARCSKLVAVNLSHTAVTDKGMEFLRELPMLRIVTLVGCSRLTDKTLTTLADHQHLMRVEMPGAGLTLKGVQDFEAAHPDAELGTRLAEFSELAGFLAASSRYRDDFAPGLIPQGDESFIYWPNGTNSTLEKQLNFSSVREICLYDDTGLNYSPLQNFKNLSAVTLAGRGVDDRIFPHLGKLKRLEILQLRDTCVTDNGFKQLGELPQLASVVLSDSDIGDGTLEVLARSPNLSRISLAGTSVTDAGITLLQDHPEISVIDLSNTAITDESLGVLAHFPHLRALNLAGTSVTDAGIQMLVAPTEPEWKVDLSRTSVTGASVVRLLDLANKAKKRVPPFGNGNRDERRLFINFRFAGTQIRDADFEAVARTSTSESSDHDGVAYITLNCSDTQIGIRGLEWLKDQPVWELALRDTPLTAEGLSALNHLSKLAYVDLVGTGVTATALSASLGTSAIRGLAITSDPEVLRSLGATLLVRKLHSLTLVGADEETLQQLVSFQKLEWLKLEQATLNTECFVALSRLSNLQHIKLSDCTIAAGTEIPPSVGTVRRDLVLFRTNVTEEQLAVMRRRDLTLHITTSNLGWSR